MKITSFNYNENMMNAIELGLPFLKDKNGVIDLSINRGKNRKYKLEVSPFQLIYTATSLDTLDDIIATSWSSSKQLKK